MYASFEEVARLSEPEARALLDRGDQTERVWAAWVLGLRAAGATRGDLLDRFEGEPTRGVRQHLIVVLAGINAVEPIAAIAIRDPSPEVRETACRLAARLVGPEREAIAESLARRFVDEPSIEVKAALIAEVRVDAPPVLTRLVRGSVRDDSLALRAAAARSLLRWDAGFIDDLREPALLEPDDELAAELLGAWIARDGAAALVDALARHEPPVVARNLVRLAAIERLPWSMLSRFAAIDDRDVTAALLEAAGELDANGWRWLLDLVAAADADSRSLQVLDDPLRARAIARLRELSPNPAGSSLSYITRDFLDAAERLVSGQALAIRDGARWWGLRITADRGSWLELARRIHPEVIAVELIVHECDDDPWIASYHRGDRAHLLMYGGEPEPGGPVDADLRRFQAEADGCAIRIDRESEI